MLAGSWRTAAVPPTHRVKPLEVKKARGASPMSHRTRSRSTDQLGDTMRSRTRLNLRAGFNR